MRWAQTTTMTTKAERSRHDVTSLEQTMDVASALAGWLRSEDVVHLRGDLGVGKTHFVKGLARGLGLDPDDVVSPTFTFVDVHAGTAGGLGLVHVDLYRIEGPSELAELGLEELPGPGAVAAIEWPDRLPPGSREPAATVTIEDLGGTSRRIVVALRAR